MRESMLEKKCCSWAKRNGWLVFKFVSPNQRGVPDRLFIKNGQHVFVEFKAPNGKLSKLQTYMINKMQAEKAVVYVVDNYGDFINVMSR